MNKLDNWWSSLTITQKERIATKAARKAGDENANVTYPACSVWWMSIDEERKQMIHDHCTNDHGLLLPEYQEGNIMSY